VHFDLTFLTKLRKLIGLGMNDGFQAKHVHNPCPSHINTTSTINYEGTSFVVDLAP